MKTAKIISVSLCLLFAVIIGALVGAAVDNFIVGTVVSGIASVAFMAPAPAGGPIVGVFTMGLCEKIQSSLIEILKSGAPQLNRTKVGFLEALLSPENNAGITKVPIETMTGKKRTVRIKYLQRGLESDVVTTPSSTCTPDVERAPRETDVEITHYVGSPGLQFTEDEMRKLCEGDAQFMNDVVRAEIDPVVVHLNKLILAAQALNMGLFSDGDDEKTVTLTSGAQHAPVPYGEKQVITEFNKIGATAKPILVGAGVLDDYAALQKIGCCNDYGVDVSRAGNFLYYNDNHLGAIFGNADNFIGFVPGHVQLLTWNKYRGSYAKKNDSWEHGTFIDPITGLTFDMKVKYDDCNEVYFLEFGVWYELWNLPSDAFAYGDPLYGVNYTLQFLGAHSA